MAFVILLFFSTLIAIYASSQGRSFLLWFVISAIFTPILSFLIIGFKRQVQQYKNQS